MVHFVHLIILVGVSYASADTNPSQCPAITKAPQATTLKCTPTVCTATCHPKYKFPKGEVTLTTECLNNKTWTIKSPKYKGTKDLPGCNPVCTPACANKGKCIAPNKCQCTQDFQGPTCRDKACRGQPAMTQNAKRTCKPSQCTVTCMPGFKFKTMATVMNLQCKNGAWVSTTNKLPANSHCEPQCNPKCGNSGKCVGHNKCQCSDKFVGPQCQHSKDKCSPKKINFNGNIKCLGSPTEMSCSLTCPDNVPFEFPPQPAYKCKFTEGKFTPAKVPKCVYGEGVEVVQRSEPISAAPGKQVQAGGSTASGGSAQDGRPASSSPTCNPPCSNGGTCVFHNTCQCAKNFGGAQCQYSVDRCSPQKTGFNGGFKCSGTMTGMSCELSCPEGIAFESPPAPAYNCEFAAGTFTPSKVPKCVYGAGVQVIQRAMFGEDGEGDSPPICRPNCLNGGTCIFHNICQCQKDFRGPQCQYRTDRCSIKKTSFNGGFRCRGNEAELSCTLSCPEGIEYEFPPAAEYVCKYSTGTFTPARIPNCVFGEGVEVIRHSSS